MPLMIKSVNAQVHFKEKSMFNFFKKKQKQQPDLVGEIVEKIMLPVVYDADLEKALNETFRPAFVGDDAAIEDESGVLNVDILRYYARANFRLTPQIQEELIKYWAINRACLMPVQDCLRNWYELVAEEQESVPEQVSKVITAFNKEFDFVKKLEDALYYSRVYGIRVCIFQFEGLTPEHYENPINWETLKNHKYKGFFMLSPQYCIPVQFEMNDPMRFRQVNYWKAANVKYHHSWVRLIHHCEVPANQLPMYLGGGVSLIQEIYEKVYQADQAANDALGILFTKNLQVQKGDIVSAMTNQKEFEEKIAWQTRLTGQFRRIFIGIDEDFQNIERSLQGVDELFGHYYEIVAAVAKIPNNRFMMTQLTGFAASGEAEDRIYNSSNLSTLQVKLNPLIEMHNKAILITNGLDYENITIQWNKCGALTEAELADIQGKRIANDVQLVQSQIIAPEKAAERLSKDKDSGYSHIDLMQPEMGNNPLDGLDFSMFANAGEPVQTADAEKWITVGGGTNAETGEGSGRHVQLDTETGVILKGFGKGKTLEQAFNPEPVTERQKVARKISEAGAKQHGGTEREYRNLGVTKGQADSFASEYLKSGNVPEGHLEDAVKDYPFLAEQGGDDWLNELESGYSENNVIQKPKNSIGYKEEFDKKDSPKNSDLRLSARFVTKQDKKTLTDLLFKNGFSDVKVILREGKTWTNNCIYVNGQGNYKDWSIERNTKLMRLLEDNGYYNRDYEYEKEWLERGVANPPLIAVHPTKLSDELGNSYQPQKNNDNETTGNNHSESMKDSDISSSLLNFFEEKQNKLSDVINDYKTKQKDDEEFLKSRNYSSDAIATVQSSAAAKLAPFHELFGIDPNDKNNVFKNNKPRAIEQLKEKFNKLGVTNLIDFIDKFEKFQSYNTSSPQSSNIPEWHLKEAVTKQPTQSPIESQAAGIVTQEKDRAKWKESQTTDSRPLQAGDVINLDGYSVLIENPKGSVRKWTDSAGRSGESVLTCHYGELQGYTGADDDYLDVFIVD